MFKTIDSMGFGLHPHQEKIMRELHGDRLKHHLEAVKDFEIVNAKELQKVYMEDPLVKEVINLIKDVHPYGEAQPSSPFVGNDLWITRQQPAVTYDSQDPKQMEMFWKMAHADAMRQTKIIEDENPFDVQMVVTDEAHIPCRNGINRRRGLEGEVHESISLEQAFPQKPQIDLRAAVRNHVVRFSDVQFLLEDNSVLSEFLEEYNEGVEFKEMTTFPNSTVIDSLTKELEDLNYAGLQEKVGDIPMEAFEQHSQLRDYEENVSREEYAENIRKRTKQRSKRRGKK